MEPRQAYDKLTSLRDRVLGMAYSTLPTVQPTSDGQPVTASMPSRPPPPASFVMEQRLSQAAVSGDRSAPRRVVDERIPAHHPAPPSSTRPGKVAVARAGSSSSSPSSPSSVSPTTSFHAQVGKDVNRTALHAVFERLVIEARMKFHQRKFEEALHLFRQCLAMVEKTMAQGDSHSEYGAILHNIASCLHCLGHFQEAKGMYERALTAFQKENNSRFWRAINGDVGGRRCDFVRERLIDIEFHRKPDLDKYLDGYGYKREVTPDLALPPPPPFNPNNNPYGGGIGGLGGVTAVGYGPHMYGYPSRLAVP